MRVCDICRGGSHIKSVQLLDGEHGDQLDTGPVDWDACLSCRKLLHDKDWIGLATRSGNGLVEDHAKRGLEWVTENVVPKVMDYVNKTNTKTKTSETETSL